MSCTCYFNIESLLTASLLVFLFRCFLSSRNIKFISRSEPSRHPIIIVSHSKMNWTGGRLSRHSRRADSSTASKQKQHFAKVRSHLMSGSVKNGPAKRPNFDMVAPQPLDELSGRQGTVKTKLQQPLVPFGHNLHADRGLYGENKHPGIYLRFDNSPRERPNPKIRPCRKLSPGTIRLYTPERCVTEFDSQLRNNTKAY